jgi:hypothetical protein
MATRSKTRSELKQYFVKNAIPTESNFAELIDGQLNQSDDGVFKQPDQPLAVVAAGGEQKRVLQLYSAYPATNPDWLLSLNPRPIGATSGTAAGLGIVDGTGATRLMLDAAGNLAVTGNLGVGGDLQVNGARIRNSSGLGLLEANANDLLRINPDGAFPAIAVYKPMSLVTGGLVVGSLAPAAQGELVVTGSASIGNTLKVAELVVTGSASIGNGLKVAELVVTGSASIGNGLKVALPGGSGGGWNQFAVSLTNNWGDAGRNFVTIGAGGAAGIMFNNPHVAWYALENRASIRYGRTGGRPGETWWDAGVRADGAFTLIANDSIGIGETLRVARTGEFTIRFPQGRWVFQADGNLVKYNNNNTVVWGINMVNARPGW